MDEFWAWLNGLPQDTVLYVVGMVGITFIVTVRVLTTFLLHLVRGYPESIGSVTTKLGLSDRSESERIECKHPDNMTKKCINNEDNCKTTQECNHCVARYNEYIAEND